MDLRFGAGSVTFAVADPDAARAAFRQPGIGALVHGTHPDGCLWFLHLFSDSREPGAGVGWEVAAAEVRP